MRAQRSESLRSVDCGTIVVLKCESYGGLHTKTLQNCMSVCRPLEGAVASEKIEFFGTAPSGCRFGKI